jgi:hypothetical protein
LPCCQHGALEYKLAKGFLQVVDLRIPEKTLYLDGYPPLAHFQRPKAARHLSRRKGPSLPMIAGAGRA